MNFSTRRLEGASEWSSDVNANANKRKPVQKRGGSGASLRLLESALCAPKRATFNREAEARAKEMQIFSIQAKRTARGNAMRETQSAGKENKKFEREEKISSSLPPKHIFPASSGPTNVAFVPSLEIVNEPRERLNE